MYQIHKQLTRWQQSDFKIQHRFFHFILLLLLFYYVCFMRSRTGYRFGFWVLKNIYGKIVHWYWGIGKNRRIWFVYILYSICMYMYIQAFYNKVIWYIYMYIYYICYIYITLRCKKWLALGAVSGEDSHLKIVVTVTVVVYDLIPTWIPRLVSCSSCI